ncbi:MAG TPA: polysaccharide deacetylase family protein [Bacillota bacterium]|nr:polysaccharide deacetylase family protein [Bacillota bacterium]
MVRKFFLVFLICSLVLPSNAADAKGRKGRYYFEKRGEIVWEVPTQQKVICFTFDDGPDPKYTPQILNVLNQYQAKATFFVTGNQVERFPQVVQKEAMQGHEIANHTFNHKYLDKYNEEGIEKEIVHAQDIIYAVTGQTTKLFRPPGGYYNERIVSAAKKHGYTVIMWSWHQETKDWSDPGVDKIVKRVLDNTRNGDIVLLHDHSGKRSQTVDAIAQIIPELKKRGYQFITVSELLRIKELEAEKKKENLHKTNEKE